MQYKTFKDEIQLSRLGMGVMRLPIADGNDAQIDYEKAEKLIAHCMEQGVNYYDTAYIYHGGKSEEFLGKALEKYPRDSFYIADKYNWKRVECVKDEQLRTIEDISDEIYEIVKKIL